MKLFLSGLAVICFCLSCNNTKKIAANTTEVPDIPKVDTLPKPTPKVKPQLKDIYHNHKGVKYNLRKKSIRVSGEMADSGILDFFLTTQYSGGAHETIMFSDFVPVDLHTALLMIGAEDAESAKAKGDVGFEGDHFKCEVTWDDIIRYAKIKPDEANKDLKPDMLYVVDMEKTDTKFDWLMLANQKIHYDHSKGEGEIKLHFEFPELKDPAKPKGYIWNHVRTIAITEKDKKVCYFHQPDKTKKGEFKPYGTLESIRSITKPRKEPLENLLVNSQAPEARYTDIKWVFSGGGFFSSVDPETDKIVNIYKADRSGFVMSLIPRGPTVLMAKSKEPLFYGEVAVDKRRCPIAGTKMNLELTLLPRESKKKESAK